MSTVTAGQRRAELALIRSRLLGSSHPWLFSLSLSPPLHETRTFDNIMLDGMANGILPNGTAKPAQEVHLTSADVIRLEHEHGAHK